MSFTLIIIAVTIALSFAAWGNDTIYNKMILWPYEMNGRPAEYYRLLTSGFIHADYLHLAFNMYALYTFGSSVEYVFHELGKPVSLYLWLYLTGIIIACLPSFLNNRHHMMYRSLGASGGVAAIIFFIIYYNPWAGIGIIFIPLKHGIPAIIFGVLYLAYEAYMSRKGTGSNINHSAHFWGSAYGLLFGFAVDPTHGRLFVQQIMNWSYFI